MNERAGRQHRPLQRAPAGHRLHAEPGDDRCPQHADAERADQHELIAPARLLRDQVPDGVADSGRKNQGQGKR